MGKLTLFTSKDILFMDRFVTGYVQGFIKGFMKGFKRGYAYHLGLEAGYADADNLPAAIPYPSRHDIEEEAIAALSQEYFLSPAVIRHILAWASPDSIPSQVEDCVTPI